MSHIATIDLEIKDLDSLSKACRDLGLELVTGQQSYKWYGRKVGNDPLPEGFSVNDLGKCSHAIRIPGNSQAYEIGVVQRRDGKQGFTLHWDFWQGGYGMEKMVGQNADRLRQAYSVQLTSKTYRKQGFKVTSKIAQDGTVTLSCTKGKR